MEILSILLFVPIVFLLVIMYNKYKPKIDIVVSEDNYIVLLWYYKYYWNGEVERTYVKLFKIQ